MYFNYVLTFHPLLAFFNSGIQIGQKILHISLVQSSYLVLRHKVLFNSKILSNSYFLLFTLKRMNILHKQKIIS